MGCAGVPRCRHPVHHVWVPPGGQQGVWQGLQRPGGHLPQAGARLRPRPLPAPITHVSPPPLLPCVQASLLHGFGPVLALTPPIV